MSKEKQRFVFLAAFTLIAFVLGQDGSGVPGSVGGRVPMEGRFPYMCSLRKANSDRRHDCGGTLIHPLWILTAAHCLDTNVKGRVKLERTVLCGIHNLAADNSARTYTAVNSMIHPSWDSFETGYDIALIKLDREVHDVKLPKLVTSTRQSVDDKRLAAVGWGRTETEETPDELRFVELEIAPSAECMGSSGFMGGKDLVVCAGNSTHDACKGDSGGPLLIADSRGQLNMIEIGDPEQDEVLGITSFGTGDCGMAETSGIYTSVAYFHDWIEGTIAEIGSAECGTPVELFKEALTAIKNKDLEEFETPFYCGLDPTAVFNVQETFGGDEEDTLLHWAARFDWARAATMLINRGADAREANSKGRTPLHYCAINGSASVAKVLLESNADHHTTDDTGFRALVYASENGHVDVVKVLLEYKADMNIVSGISTRYAPLHVAAREGHLTVVQRLLESGAKVDVTSSDGEMLYTSPHGKAMTPSLESCWGRDKISMQRTIEAELHCMKQQHTVI